MSSTLKTKVQEFREEALGKQDKLTPGSNIQISQTNVISATVPTKTSQLQNDSNYITESSLNPYRTATEQNTIDATKQPKLTAGTNITIDGNNVISSQGGGAGNWSELTGKPFSSIDSNTLKVESNVLKVNTTDDAEEDNTKPITSSGVHAIVGNIDALLSQI